MRTPVLLIVLSYLVLIVSDMIIISDLRKMSLYDKFAPSRGTKKPGWWWKVYLVFAILTLSLLTVGIAMPKKNIHSDLSPMMWMLYVVLSIMLPQCIYSIVSIIGRLPSLFRHRRWNTGLWIGLPLGVLIFVLMWWGVIFGRNRIQTVKVEIDSPKVPESFDGYKIAQISDLHVGTWGNDTAFISRLVERVNELHPDLIIFTGDIVNRMSDELVPFIGPLSRLKAPDGVLTILGNHDYGDYISWENPEEKRSNLESLKNYQKSMGWKMLDNSHMTVAGTTGDSIVVIGVGNWGEPPFTKYGDLKRAIPEAMLNDNNFKILLSHNPEHWNREVSHISNIDFTLSGHTHAMQLMFSIGKWRWSPSKYRYEQWGGLYERENDNGVPTKLYVNIGAGEVGIPFRIGADPEITLFTLHRTL